MRDGWVTVAVGVIGALAGLSGSVMLRGFERHKHLADMRKEVYLGWLNFYAALG